MAQARQHRQQKFLQIPLKNLESVLKSRHKPY